MADESYFSQMLNALRSTPSYGPPNVTTDLAPPLPAYPSQHDADYARNYGFGTNSINEDYLNNNRARVLGQNMTVNEPTKKGTSSASREVFLPASGAGSDSSGVTDPKNSVDVNLNKNPELQGNLRNVMMQAALAANRSPIAAMGFDPSRVVVDSMIKKPNIAGLYRPDFDMQYTALDPDDAIVHESTHRGLQKLREKYPAEADSAMSKLGAKGSNLSEELVVRWLMASKAGDPEGNAGSIDKKQRELGIQTFDPKEYPINATARREALNQLEELAIKDRLTRSRRSGPQ